MPYLYLKIFWEIVSIKVVNKTVNILVLKRDKLNFTGSKLIFNSINCN